MDPRQVQTFRDKALQSGYTPEEVENFILQKTAESTSMQLANPEPREGFKATDLLPIAGGIVGGVGGSFVAPGAGTVVGGAAGSAAGEALRQYIEGEDADYGKIALEGGLGLAGGVAGKVVGKAGSLVGKTVGKGLVEGSENLALKALRPTKTMLTKFAQQHGEDLAQVVTRNNLVGKSAQEIGEQAIKPLQSSFDDIVERSGLKVDMGSLDRKFTEIINKLADSPSLTDNKLADDLANEYVNIINKAGNGPINIKTINEFRRVFDSKVRDFAADPIMAGKNRLIGNALRDVVQETADNAGMIGAGGRSLKDLGLELSKLYNVRDIAELQGNLGRGNLPVGLLDLLGFGAGAELGGVVGGPGGRVVGAGLTMVGTKVANNPKTIAAMSALGQKVGQGIGKSGEVIAQTAGQGAARVGNSTVNSGESDPQGNAYGDQNNQLHSRNIAPEADFVNTALQDEGVTEAREPVTGYSVDQLGAAYAAALAAGDTAAAKQLKAMYDFEVEHEKNSAGGGRPLSGPNAKDYNKAQTAIKALDRVEQTLSQDPTVLVKKVNPLDQSGRQIGSDLASVIDLLGYFRTGASITPEQRKDYEYMLPNALDSEASKQMKIQRLRDEFAGYIDGLEQSRGTMDMQAAQTALGY